MSEENKTTALGILTGFVSTKPADLDRRERYRVQDVLVKKLRAKYPILEKDGKKEYIMPSRYSRVCGCCRTQLSTTSVNLNENGRAFFGNLLHCGNVWLCDVCAAKIQAVRGEEIQTAVEYEKANNKKAILLTLTHPHHTNDKLADLADNHMLSLRKMRMWRGYRKLKNEVGFDGLIRNAEVTWGINGWHWHTHEIWFVDTDVNIKIIKRQIRHMWFKSCRKNGLFVARQENETVKAYVNRVRAFLKHSVDVSFADNASHYLAKMGLKWNISKEIAKSNSKNCGGQNPFSLIESNFEKFLEYAEATAGKKQIFWSQGLKERVGVLDKTDEEIVEEKEVGNEIALLEKDAWNCVIRNHARADIKEIAEHGGFSGLVEWFNDYGIMIKKGRGKLKYHTEEDNPEELEKRLREDFRSDASASIVRKIKMNRQEQHNITINSSSDIQHIKNLKKVEKSLMHKLAVKYHIQM